MKKILVHVKPNAKASELECRSNGDWHARLISAPAEGKANAELVQLVAAYFGVARSRVTIKSGRSGRTKLVQVDN